MENITSLLSKMKEMDTIDSHSKTTIGQTLSEDYLSKLLDLYINNNNYSAY